MEGRKEDMEGKYGWKKWKEGMRICKEGRYIRYGRKEL
jgi:hypothetical protein